MSARLSVGGQGARTGPLMSDALTAGQLFDSHHERLKLTWLAGREGADTAISFPPRDAPDQKLVDYLNPGRPHPIQLIGRSEHRYLSSLDATMRKSWLTSIFHTRPAMLILTDGLEAGTELVEMAEATMTPLLATPLEELRVMEYLQYQLEGLAADSEILHGVFLEVLGIGVLLTGLSGAGKSELALELINRGHRLIADDAAQFSCRSPSVIIGNCPQLLRDFLEVRGLGILNIRAMFGDNALLSSKRLRLIISLDVSSEKFSDESTRLDGGHQLRNIQGVEIPQLTVPVAPGRNLAVIIEAAVRNHLLTRSGYNAADDFIERQKRFMAGQKP